MPPSPSSKNSFQSAAPGPEVDQAGMIEVAESRDAVTAGGSWIEQRGSADLLDVHHAGWHVIVPAPRDASDQDASMREARHAAGPVKLCYSGIQLWSPTRTH